MPRDKEIPGSAQIWLTRAKGDLALARAPLPEDAFYEDLCFHAKQAAEKSIKAVYQCHGWTFRYTHNLEELLTGLKRLGLEISPELKNAVTLTHYAWAARYPEFGEPVSPDEYHDALRQAEIVVAWAEKEIPGE